MKKLVLLFCLLVSVASAHAQFEKGKWVVNPSLTGLGLSYDTGLDKASFGLDWPGCEWRRLRGGQSGLIDSRWPCLE